MASDIEHIKGRVDEVLHLSDGSLAPLDYKYAEYKEFLYRTHRYQSILYAMLIKEAYEKDVRRGFICYVRSKNKIVEVVYKDSNFSEARRINIEILRIIQTGHFPKRISSRIRCIDCCYRNICV